jgi:hypothetical protein
MAPLQQSVGIARPLEEVFAFVANPANDARWGSNLVEVTRVSPGPLGAEARFCYKARFAGRQFELVREVTEDEPNRWQAVKTISGPAAVGRRPHLRGDPGRHPDHLQRWRSVGRVLRFAEPLLLRAAPRSLRTNLASLKRLLEGQPQD